MRSEKVMAGMSGGVDSSVCASLLIDGGYSVAGVTLDLWGKDSTASPEAEEAEKVCERLGIPHYVFEMREDFAGAVIDDFINEYINGATPNPCIVCNRKIKFGKMLEYAENAGYSKIATGHYAVVKKDGNGRYLLSKAADRAKDQTYVLYSLTQEQLSSVVFPLGGLTKAQVREIAESKGFSNAHKPDSQDICFVPDGDYAAFIEKYTGKISVPGEFTDINGCLIGKHNGLIRYTVGQRKGLGISLGKPAYVVAKDTASNRVVLGDEEQLFYRRVLVRNVNFIPFDRLEGDMRVTAKLRYRHNEQPARIIPDENGVIVEFDEPQRAPSPGQSAVFYDRDTVVGGGIIVKGI